MFVGAIMALQTESNFAKRYAEGMNKKDYWEAAFDDAMDLIARLPRVAAYIYRRKYKNNRSYSSKWSARLGGQSCAHARIQRRKLQGTDAFVHDHSCRS